MNSASLGANVLGVVVNGVGDGRQVYGYSTYQYGYKYEYNYDYTYPADDYCDSNHGYYQEEEEATAPGTNGHASNGNAKRRKRESQAIRRLPLWKRLFR